MWLLSTDRAELHYFIDPEAVPGGYAILSHVWGEDEQLFHDTPRYRKDMRPDRPNVRDTTASEKVRQICKIAERDRLRWLWDDTCCINKDSSSELSESINSMFRYYSLAAVCYAYLADVPIDRFSDDLKAPFAQSKWHRRGWTLQELIAATVVEFISADWQKLGTKMEHASLLSRITKIPVEVLLMEQPVSDISVAQRMSWACDRETTRLEDRAYSLMGIFSVNMTTLYGEGERAFQRLQEEIMKQTIDPSLLAWGRIEAVSVHDLPDYGVSHAHADSRSYLLARSPDDFAPRWSGRTTLSPTISHAVPAYSGWNKVPACTMTPYGCLSRLVCFDRGELTLAWTACHFQDEDTVETLSLWLILQRCPDPPPHDAKPLYHCGNKYARLAAIRLDTHRPSDPSFGLRSEELYIALWHTTPKRTAYPIPVALEHERIRTPFRITADSLRRAFWTADERINLDSVPTVRFDWDGHVPIAFHLSFSSGRGSVKKGLWLVLGVCDSVQPGQHYASFHPHPAEESPSADEYLTHSCEWDHISTWPEGQDDRGRPDGSRMCRIGKAGRSLTIVLSFTPCPVYGPGVLVLGPGKEPVDEDELDNRYIDIRPSHRRRGMLTENDGRLAYGDHEPELRMQRQRDVASAASMRRRLASAQPTPSSPPSEALDLDPHAGLGAEITLSTTPQATHSDGARATPRRSDRRLHSPEVAHDAHRSQSPSSAARSQAPSGPSGSARHSPSPRRPASEASFSNPTVRRGSRLPEAPEDVASARGSRRRKP
ncbi:heterokaryon incompatibility protein-domain-containing protein [Dichomitus squalens]|uniref:Heterokaryon incompatibility protein-domain-containing protein n=1 Tax=Dichomitus squalens TaxID=114155 RepID=A0A4Q9PAB4_9APHY|nr:heterokaryon incompatibility protein-domain-containing protein [Dichomitus squalens]